MTTLTQRMNVVEENLQSIRLTLDTLLQNLLNPALMVPGTLRFGGNRMQLDNNGVQINTDGTARSSVFFVDDLVADPTLVKPRAYILGNADNASGNSSVGLTSVSSAATNFIATVSTTASTSDAQVELLGNSNSGENAKVGVLMDGSTYLYAYMQGAVRLSDSTLAPAQITANQDNYSPTNLYKTSVLRLTTDASRDITGIVPGPAGRVDGRILFIYNVGGFNIVLKNDVTSTAANRFLFPADITLAPNEGIGLMYDSTSSRWRCFGRY
jgi:hypothetical protein